jgi:hypothetical protein
MLGLYDALLVFIIERFFSCVRRSREAQCVTVDGFLGAYVHFCGAAIAALY